MGNKSSRKRNEESPPLSQQTLYVILPYSNPIHFSRRSTLYKETLARLNQAKAKADGTSWTITILTSQLLYGDEPDQFSSATTMTFRVASDQVLWSKENLINLAIKRTINEDPSAKYFAWVDADIEFSSGSWIKDTIEAIDSADAAGGGFVQLFSNATHLGPNGENTTATPSFAAQFAAGKTYASHRHTNTDYWHPGFAWGCSRSTLERFEARQAPGVYLIDRTLGGADRHMAMAFIRLHEDSVPNEMSAAYRQMVVNWAEGAVDMTLRPVAGTIRHYWHGSLANRKYVERWDILSQHNFDPSRDMTYNEEGVLVWSEAASRSLMANVLQYFRDRQEDEVPAAGPSRLQGGEIDKKPKKEEKKVKETEEREVAVIDAVQVECGDDAAEDIGANNENVVTNDDPNPIDNNLQGYA